MILKSFIKHRDDYRNDELEGGKLIQMNYKDDVITNIEKVINSLNLPKIKRESLNEYLINIRPNIPIIKIKKLF
jgi:hypothetical protein